MKNFFLQTLKVAESTFFLWVAVGGVLGYVYPSTFSSCQHLVVPGLAVIMTGMGLSITLDDLRRVLKRRGDVLFGAAAQYTIMPLTAFLLAWLFQLGPELTVGLVLVGSSPGGTASNLICYLAKADVAYSVSMTSFSTLIAPLMTPMLTWLLVHHYVPVPAIDLLISIAQIVLIPVAGGVTLRYFWEKWVNRLLAFVPLVCMLTITFLLAIVVALNAGRMAEVGLPLAATVVLLNLVGFGGGYGAACLWGMGEQQARTVSIEVGIQNAGLAVAVAVQFFSPVAALPGALFSMWHVTAGSMLANYFALRTRKADEAMQAEGVMVTIAKPE